MYNDNGSAPPGGADRRVQHHDPAAGDILTLIAGRSVSMSLSVGLSGE
jgi:hypothetical protein